MLGKQGWKLMTDQDDIISRVFKAKYYPRSGFLEARLGHNPSYVWRSIHSSRVVVKEGARWRIGDGRDIKVWADPWLRNVDNARITTPTLVGKEDMCVSALINSNDMSWKEEEVRQLFQQHDIEEILRIPLWCSNRCDKLIWRFSRDGKFSVRSTYHYTMEQLIDNQDLRVPGNWRAIWCLNIPNRVKVFLWRVARGVLPTRQKLQRKGVQCVGECAFCHRAPENEWHLFVGCDKAVEVWQELGIWGELEPRVFAAEGFSELLFDVLDNSPPQRRQVIAMTIWSIWWKRNNLIWENTNKSPAETVRRATESLQDWLNLRHQHKEQLGHSQAVVTNRWTKPAQGSLKCNVDAAMFQQSNCYGVGMCLRDDKGAFIKARTVWKPGSPMVKEAEAFGLLEALSWLKDMNVTNVLIELDSLTVVESMKGHLSIPTEYGNIISKCMELRNTSNNFMISFIRRQANRVAHNLARASLLFASRQDFDYMLPCIENVILNEMI